MGCYVNSAYHQFNSFASHLDANTLTPYTCVMACSAVHYGLAAIEDGQFCFCQKSLNVLLEKYDDTNCTALKCPGNNNFACGGKGFWMVYEAGQSVTVCIYNFYQLYII